MRIRNRFKLDNSEAECAEGMLEMVVQRWPPGDVTVIGRHLLSRSDEEIRIKSVRLFSFETVRMPGHCNRSGKMFKRVSIGFKSFPRLFTG